MARYAIGKFSHAALARLLARFEYGPRRDVLVGPRIGEDAAVVRLGRECLVVATDPVTFAAERIGWYAVQINANDVATMGARPRWFQACVLMPARSAVTVESIFADIAAACRTLAVAVIGGHTEVTAGIEQPIVVGTMMGVVERAGLITSSGARPGQSIVMTKSAAVEATAIIARERGRELAAKTGAGLVRRARWFLFDPGICVVREAMIAARCGATAMHDPTEGGILAGLWELARASNVTIRVDTEAIPVAEETQQACQAFGIDPLRAIGSGSLLIAIRQSAVTRLLGRLRRAKIPAALIASAEPGPGELRSTDGRRLRPSARDEIARLYET